MLRTARRMELLHERTSARERGGALFDFVWISSLLILFFFWFPFVCHEKVTCRKRHCIRFFLSSDRDLSREISLGKVMEMFEGGVLAVACDK